MRILAAIPHFYNVARTGSPDGRAHGSVSSHADARAAALQACVAALHQHYGSAQHIIDQATRVALPANERTSGQQAE